MFRRVFMLVAATIVAMTLGVLASAEPAGARSTVAATAVNHCKTVQTVAAKSSRSKGERVPTSANLGKAKRLCQEVRRSVGTLRFWSKPTRRWTLYKHYRRDTCWSLRRKQLLQGPEGLCAVARGAVRVNTQKLVKLDQQIKPLLPKPQPRIKHDWLYADLMCIHNGYRGGTRVGSGEGGMSSVGYVHGVPTYYGGWQMDYDFMRAYGAEFLARWGTANNWPAWAQLTAAVRAYKSGRGFYPWPNTAHDCSLI